MLRVRAGRRRRIKSEMPGKLDPIRRRPSSSVRRVFVWRLGFLLASSSAIFCAMWVEPARAQADVKRLKASHPLYKLIGQVSVADYPKNYGQGSFLGDDGCHVLTNYHVAFQDGWDAEGQPKILSEPTIGREVAFSYNPDDAGRFQNVVQGKVLEFGNFMRGAPRGRLGDLALIRLNECQKGIRALKFDQFAL